MCRDLMGRTLTYSRGLRESPDHKRIVFGSENYSGMKIPWNDSVQVRVLSSVQINNNIKIQNGRF